MKPNTNTIKTIFLTFLNVSIIFFLPLKYKDSCKRYLHVLNATLSSDVYLIIGMCLILLFNNIRETTLDVF